MTKKLVSICFIDNEVEIRNFNFVYEDDFEKIDRKILEFLRQCFKDSFAQYESETKIIIKTEATNVKDNAINSQ